MTNPNNPKRSSQETEGWVKKFTIEEHRVNEYKELYESLGHEVKVEFVVPSEIEECAECFKTECEKYRTIYTRPKKTP